jgi:tetratricopeptide (TPR) repeat protein
VAVVLSAYDLLVRADAIGSDTSAFAASVPNRTFCTDGRLARVSFMTEADRNHFLSIARLTLGSFARADKRQESVDADWIEVGRHAGVVAAWLRGAPRDPLVVPVSWTPTEFEFGTWEDMKEHLEFLGVEGNVDVYLDKRTGKKLYTGRTRPSLPPQELARLEALRREGGGLVQPFLLRKDLGFFEKRRLKKGMALLEQVLAAIPDQWSACWLLGMSHRALAENDRALDHFRRAYTLNPEHPDVGREYAGQCFYVGAAEEGVRISREIHVRFPNDVGLQSNLALALLIGGDLAEAQAVAEAAHMRDRADPITMHLLNLIREVRAGRKPRPTRMPGT